jgi:hypothetical protein
MALSIRPTAETGPKSRFTAAVQPPRVIHTGLRLTF